MRWFDDLPPIVQGLLVGFVLISLTVTIAVIGSYIQVHYFP